LFRAVASSHSLHLFDESQASKKAGAEQKSGGSKYNVISGNVIHLGDGKQDDSE
jgi:hypothetical protein